MTAAKAAQYLAAGRVVLHRVDDDTVAATVRGDGATYQTGWTRRAGWSCTCPARSRCAHLRAVGLVVVVAEHEVERDRRPPPGAPPHVGLTGPVEMGGPVRVGRVTATGTASTGPNVHLDPGPQTHAGAAATGRAAVLTAAQDTLTGATG